MHLPCIKNASCSRHLSIARHSPFHAFLIILLTAQTSLAAVIEGQEIPDTIPVSGTTLTLSGCGKREMLWSDLYFVSLYLAEPANDIQQILDDNTPKAIHLKVLYQNDLPDELPTLWKEPLQEEMNKEMFNIVLNLYEEINTDDIIIFSYHPNTGSRVTLNGDRKIERDSSTLVTALLDNWIGEQAVSENLKRLLLSKSCQ